jgi:hypothetical protein
MLFAPSLIPPVPKKPPISGRSANLARRYALFHDKRHPKDMEALKWKLFSLRPMPGEKELITPQ